jgi:hypothetical protein
MIRYALRASIIHGIVCPWMIEARSSPPQFKTTIPLATTAPSRFNFLLGC